MYSVLHVGMQSLISLQVFVAIHIAAITATSWILMLNGAVGYQLLDDGTAVSIGLLLISSLVIFIGTGYIALDTGLNWTGYWEDTRFVPNQAYALYTTSLHRHLLLSGGLPGAAHSRRAQANA